MKASAELAWCAAAAAGSGRLSLYHRATGLLIIRKINAKMLKWARGDLLNEWPLMKPHVLNLRDEEKRLLWQLRAHGPQARSDLAHSMQVSNGALTKLSQGLLMLGLIEELEPEAVKGRGRPTIPLRVSAAGGYAVGVTIHAGILEIALVDYAGRVISLTSEGFDPIAPQQFAQLVDRRIHELAVEHRLLSGRLFGVGMSLPGPALSRDRNRWSIVHTLPGWRNVPLRQIMDDILGLPVWLENDATAAALAEYYLGGLAQRCSTLVVVLIGHGVGAGVISGGRLMRGEVGSGGEIGMLYPNGRPRPTTLDLLATLQAAGCRVRSLADFERATIGFECTIEQWLDRAADQILLAVNTALAWLDPGAIRLLSPLPLSIVQRLADRVNNGRIVWGDHRSNCEVGKYDIEVSNLGGAASALGAALLPVHASIQRE